MIVANTYTQQFRIVYVSSNNVGHLITKSITTLQHFATLRYTSPHFTQLHFSTLIGTSLPLIYTSLPYRTNCEQPATGCYLGRSRECGDFKYARRENEALTTEFNYKGYFTT